jgi:hypothetical protein
VCFAVRLMGPPDQFAFAALVGRILLVAPAIAGIDLFKIVGRSISGWIPSCKMSTVAHVKQPFYSQLEERLWLEYRPHKPGHISFTPVRKSLTVLRPGTASSPAWQRSAPGCSQRLVYV